MGFDIDRFMGWKPTEAAAARAAGEWQGVLTGIRLARAWDAQRTGRKPPRKPRKGSKAEAFLRLLTEHPSMPAARLNALLPKPMDESTARRLAREWRGF